MKGMLRLTAFRNLLLGVSACALGGCAHYELGTGTAVPAFRTIYVEPIQNTAALPQAVATFSRAIRNAFAADGRVELAGSAASADVILRVDLAQFERTFTSVQPNDTALARKFDLNIVALCSLEDHANGRMLWNHQEIRVTRQIFVDDGQNPAEYQVQPQLAAQLADRVVHRVLDVW